MLLNELLKDQGRLLLRKRGDNTEAGAGSKSNLGASWIYIVGLLVMLVMVAISCFRMVRSLKRNHVDAPDLPSDIKVPKTQRKSTLAKHKQAVLEHFETSQVTMVSND